MNQGHIPSSNFLFAFLLQHSPPNIKASFIILIEKPFGCKIYETQKKKKKKKKLRILSTKTRTIKTQKGKCMK